ncbi:MAG: leucine-rich repeat domain-containing protein [Acutalibacteraceae bacterium]
MKKHSFTKILISVIVLILSMTTIIAFAASKDTGKNYDESKYKIIDNVVYSQATDSKGKPYYWVTAYGPTKAIREKITEVNIVSEIDGIPVTTISLYGYDDESDEFGLDIDTLYPNVTKITIPDSVTDIREGSFAGLTKIKSITLPKNLKSLGGDAFNGLQYITEITIPEKITSIPNRAFLNCINLKKVTFEGDVTNIGDRAFANCKNLEKIPQLDNLKSIGDGAFYGCSKIKSVYLPETLEKLGYGAFAKTGLRSVTVPSKTKFGSYDEDKNDAYGTFGGCKSLKTVVFENRTDTVYLIDNLFNGCTALETVVLPASAKSVAVFARAFKNCTKLNTITNSERIGNILEAGFANCKSLKTLKLSSKTSYIESKAFYGCSKLASVTYTGTKAAPDIRGKKAFYGTPDGIKFIVKNTTVAKSLKTELKGSGVKNAKIYTGPSYKLAYKNVK